jgi:flagellar basal-body rod modification protein FlgD
MTPAVNSSSNNNDTTSGSTSGSSSTATMFMQLLIAQLEHQDPMNPTDGTQFVTELAQFQELQTTVTTGQDVSAIRQDLDQLTGQTTSQTQS